MPIYRGSCHCGHVTFEVDGDIRGAMECNCSLCRRKGALWHAAAAEQMRITSGVSPFSHPRIDPSLWVVNVRCLDLESLPVQLFDGEHWEEAAKALIERRRGKTP